MLSCKGNGIVSLEVATASGVYGRERVVNRLERVGQTTITGKNQISLPASGLRRLGWGRGDRLLVQVLNEDILVIIRQPDSWTEEFSGQLGHVFGSHEENLSGLDSERREWDEAPGRAG